MNKLASLALATAVAAPFALATAGVAEAGGTAPACVVRTHWQTQHGRTVLNHTRLTNHCGRAMRVRVIASGGPDSRCYSLPNYGDYADWTGANLHRYARAAVC